MTGIMCSTRLGAWLIFAEFMLLAHACFIGKPAQSGYSRGLLHERHNDNYYGEEQVPKPGISDEEHTEPLQLRFLIDADQENQAEEPQLRNILDPVEPSNRFLDDTDFENIAVIPQLQFDDDDTPPQVRFHAGNRNMGDNGNLIFTENRPRLG